VSLWKGTKENYFIPNNRVSLGAFPEFMEWIRTYLRNKLNKAVHLHGTHRMILRAFKEYAEWGKSLNWFLLIEYMELMNAPLQNRPKENVHIHRIHKITLNLNISANLKPKLKLF
jgi:hypothetical protein